MPRWERELAEVGWPVERLEEAVREAGLRMRVPSVDGRQVVAEVLDSEGELARQKVFARKEVIVDVAPQLFGQDPAMLERLVARAVADPETVPVVRVACAREAVQPGVRTGPGGGDRGEHRADSGKLRPAHGGPGSGAGRN
jgi:hypothetical protein